MLQPPHRATPFLSCLLISYSPPPAAYIKLGQALSIRPDILSPAAMNELQKLCDKVPSFDSKIAMQVRGGRRRCGFAVVV